MFIYSDLVTSDMTLAFTGVLETLATVLSEPGSFQPFLTASSNSSREFAI